MWPQGSTRSTTSPSCDPEAPLSTPLHQTLSLTLAGFALAGCPTATPSTLEQCELDLALDTDSAMVGDTVTAFGRPITAEIDTAVTIDGQLAALVDVDRAQPACETCDACRLTAGCGVCEECGVCATFCTVCIEYVAFAIPEVEPGEHAVTVVNSYGVSASMPLTVVAPPDDG